MKLHRMCSMSGKSHQSNGSSELSPSILLRGRSGGRMPQIVAGRGWWVREGSRPSARLTPASSLSHPSQMGRQATGSQAVLLCYKILVCLSVCGGFELRQTLLDELKAGWWSGKHCRLLARRPHHHMWRSQDAGLHRACLRSDMCCVSTEWPLGYCPMIFTCEEITYCVNDFTSKRTLCWLWKWRWVFVACVFKWYWI